MDLSGVTREFCKQMVRDHAIPLDLGYPIGIPDDETLAAMREADEVIANERIAPFTYVVKVTCDVTNRCGATAKDQTLEATVVYEDGAWIVTDPSAYWVRRSPRTT